MSSFQPSRRAVLKSATLSATAVAAGCAHLGSPRRKRPNVLFILTDDQRFDCLGCAPRPYLGIQTPNLDRIAREGAYFSNAFCTTSLCSPSRASMLSGLYAHSHKIINNFTDYPRDLPSYPARLKAMGYTTAYIGKFHMGEQDDSPRPGFDYWASHGGQGAYPETTWNINGTRELKKRYYTQVVTELATNWLRGQTGDKPFCMIMGHKAPHGPFVPEPKYQHTYDGVPINYPDSAFSLEDKPAWIKERLDTWHGIYGPLYGFRKEFPDRSKEGVKVFGDFVRSYVGTINSIDDSVGAVYRALADTGRLDDTIIIFTSDNPFLLGEHGMIDKRTMHEESIRIPLLMRYPEAIRPGTVVDEMALTVDLAPTILDLCDAEPLRGIHGRSMTGLLAGKTAGWRQSWFYEYNYEKQFPYTPNVRGVRTKDWKYVHYPHGDGGPDRHKAELYDLKNDPRELRNLIDDPKAAGKLAELKTELARLMKETGALPDSMPVDEGIKTELPEKSIR